MYAVSHDNAGYRLARLMTDESGLEVVVLLGPGERSAADVLDSKRDRAREPDQGWGGAFVEEAACTINVCRS